MSLSTNRFTLIASNLLFFYNYFVYYTVLVTLQVDRLSGWKVCDNTTFAEAFQHQFVMVQQVRHISNQTILISCETTESIIRMEFESYGVQSNGHIM
ncbi:unnamed protein product [Vicia faba]|uniref:Secreted protein n=1 Tax=Vicia faba TaxID=3906 RepID=A0AAV0Z6B7_VICFA|nr:unnamed protein product [Vicia faba]